MTDLYVKLFDAGCVKFGKFKLKSGIMSPVYVDFRVLTSIPSLLAEVGKALGEKAKEIGCDRIAGIPYAGLPLGVAAAISSDIPLIYPRKEAKEYGTGKLIEGEHKEGERVVVIDDIITDGASKFEAIEPLEAAGLVITDVLVILDREQGGKRQLARRGYSLHSLGTLMDVIDALVEAGKIESGMRKTVADFIEEHQFA
jgi:orotate phosphoribosyltransferase